VPIIVFFLNFHVDLQQNTITKPICEPFSWILAEILCTCRNGCIGCSCRFSSV